MTSPSLSPFTSRRKRFIDSLSEVLQELDDPECVDVSTTYEFRVEQTKEFGLIPKIRFVPYGKDCWWKAEVVRRAGLVSKDTTAKVERLREDLGYQGARDREHRVLARQFESYWNKLVHQLTKAAKALSYVNYALSKQECRLAEPIKLIQQTALQEMDKK